MGAPLPRHIYFIAQRYCASRVADIQAHMASPMQLFCGLEVCARHRRRTEHKLGFMDCSWASSRRSGDHEERSLRSDDGEWRWGSKDNCFESLFLGFYLRAHLGSYQFDVDQKFVYIDSCWLRFICYVLVDWLSVSVTAEINIL